MTAALEGGEWSAARPGRTLPPGKTLYPFYRRLGGPQGPVWTYGKSRPHRDSILDRPARSSVAIPTELLVLCTCCMLRLINIPCCFMYVGPDSSDRYSDSLRAGSSRDRVPVGGEIFRIRPDRRWDPPSFLYNGYRVSLPGVKRPGRGVDHPPPSSAKVKGRVGLYLYSLSGPSWPGIG